MTTGIGESEREALNGHARIRAEIDQQPELALRHSQIVEDLPTVFVSQSANRLELQDYLSKAKDIWYVLLLDFLAFVENRQFLLASNGMCRKASSFSRHCW